MLCDFQTITYILDNSTVINDGQQHFVGVEFQAGQKLRLLRNGNVVRSNTLPSSGGCSLNASHLIFGGEIPQSLRQTGRVRRNTDVVIADGNSVPKLTELGNFKGTIQDAELNDNKLVFFPGNTSVESNFTLTSLTEVEANEVSDDSAISNLLACTMGHVLMFSSMTSGVTVHEDSGERHAVKSTFVILIPAQAQQHATVYIMDLNVFPLHYSTTPVKWNTFTN